MRSACVGPVGRAGFSSTTGRRGLDLGLSVAAATGTRSRVGVGVGPAIRERSAATPNRTAPMPTTTAIFAPAESRFMASATSDARDRSNVPCFARPGAFSGRAHRVSYAHFPGDSLAFRYPRSHGSGGGVSVGEDPSALRGDRHVRRCPLSVPPSGDPARVLRHVRADAGLGLREGRARRPASDARSRCCSSCSASSRCSASGCGPASARPSARWRRSRTRSPIASPS